MNDNIAEEVGNCECMKCGKSDEQNVLRQCSEKTHSFCDDCNYQSFMDAAFSDSCEVGICLVSGCTGKFLLDEHRMLFEPEIFDALVSATTVFKCSICFESFLMKSGLRCKGNGVPNDDSESHAFCSGCVKTYVGVNEANISHGIAGVVCMEYTCKGALAIADMRQHFDMEYLQPLENRIADENLGRANIAGFRRCRRCNYGTEVIDRCFFTCLCGFRQCLTCGEEYVDDHGSVNCLENRKKSKAQLLEEELSQAVIRRCHKCNLQFMKKDGCNFMTCRCKATQCYICRKPDIDDSHFCKCREDLCPAECHQFQNADEYDARIVDGITAFHRNSQLTHTSESSTIGTPVVTPFPPHLVYMPLPSPSESIPYYERNTQSRSPGFRQPFRNCRRRDMPPSSPSESIPYYERNSRSRSPIIRQTFRNRRRCDMPPSSPPESVPYNDRNSRRR